MAGPRVGAIINAGPMLSLPRRGCSLLHKPMRRCVNPLGGEPLTGEPDAGNPPVRFGGRGSETNRLSLPPISNGNFQFELHPPIAFRAESSTPSTFFGINLSGL